MVKGGTVLPVMYSTASVVKLRQRYREGQEDQLGALGLVLNIIVLWNTIYMDAVLTQLRQEGYPVRDEDVARLSRRPAGRCIRCSPVDVTTWILGGIAGT